MSQEPDSYWNWRGCLGRSGWLRHLSLFCFALVTLLVTCSPILATDGFAADGVSGVAVGTVTRLPVITGISGILVEQGGGTLLINEGVAISRFDLNSGSVQTVVSNLARQIGPGLVMEPGGASVLTFAYVCNPGCSGELVRVNLATGEITSIAGGLTSPQALVLEPSGASVLVTQGGTGLLSRIDLNTGVVSTVASGLGTSQGFPHGIALESNGDTALVASMEGGGWGSRNGILYRVDLNTGAVSVVSRVGGFLTDIVLEMGGTTAIATTLMGGCCQGDIVRIDLASGTATLIYSTGDPGIYSNWLQGLALEPSGTTALTVAGGPSFSNTSALLGVNLGAVQSSQILSYLVSPKWVAVEPNGSKALLSAGAGLFRADLETGRVDLVTSGYASLEQISIEATGTTGLLLFKDYCYYCRRGGLLRVDLITSAASLAADFRDTTGPSSPEGIVLESSGLAALVTDTGGTLWRVNLADGLAQAITSGFSSLVGVAISATGEEAYVTGVVGTIDGIYRVDLSTGQVTPVTQEHAVFRNPKGIVIEAGGTTALFTAANSSSDVGQHGLFRLDLVTGQPTLIASLPTSFAQGIALERGGAAVLIAAGNHFLRVALGAPEPPPILSISPSSLDFGSVAVGSTKDLSLTVTNGGGGTLTGSCTTTAPFSLPGGCSFSLGAGESAPITIRFSPTSAGTFIGNVTFTSNGGDLSPEVKGEGIAAVPVITSAVPDSGWPDLPVSINGSNFGALQGLVGEVRFGSTPARVISWSDSQIQVIVPNLPPGSYLLTVTTVVATSNAVPFTVTTPRAVITDVAPANGPPGAGLTISGLRFGAIQGKSVLKVGQAKTVILDWTDSRILAVVPSLSPGVYNVTVATELLGTSNAVPFSVTPRSSTALVSVLPDQGINFGRVRVNRSATENLIVLNAGDGLLVGSVAAAAPFSIVSGGSFFLLPGQRQIVEVQFSPVGEGVVAGQVDVFSNGGDFSKPLTGSGGPTPVLIVPGALGSFSTQVFKNNQSVMDEFSGIFYLKEGRAPNFTSDWVLDPLYDTYTSIWWALWNNGFAPVAVPYDWRIPSQDHMWLLMNAIDKAKSDYGISKVDVVAHSMGGLIVRNYIQNAYRNDIDHFAMLGTPNHGAVRGYLAWEGGDYQLGDTPIVGRLGGEVLLCLMEKAYDYIALEYDCRLPLLNPDTDVRFVQEKIKSAKDLMPTFPFLRRVLRGKLVGTRCEKNAFLIELNSKKSLPKLVSQGVTTKMFAGTGQPTLSEIVRKIGPTTCTDAPSRWEDGEPTSSSSVTAGDGTVLLTSAMIDEVGGIPEVPKPGEHDKLPDIFQEEVIRFLNE